MPVPITEALDAHEEAARAKATQATSSLPRYLLSSMMAGAYVGVAVVLLIMTSAAFIAAKSPDTKLVQGAVFGVALGARQRRRDRLCRLVPREPRRLRRVRRVGRGQWSHQCRRARRLAAGHP